MKAKQSSKFIEEYLQQQEKINSAKSAVKNNVNNPLNPDKDYILHSVRNRCIKLIQLGFNESAVKIIKEYTSMYYTEDITNN